MREGEPTQPEHRRRKRRASFVAAALLVPLAVLGLARWLLDPISFASRHVDAFERIAATVLERRLTVGSVEGHLYPELDVTVHDLVLAGRGASAQPMLVVPTTHVRFDLRRALLTFGRDLPVDAVHIDGAVLRVHRDRHGNIDVADVLRKLPPLNPVDLRGAVLSAFTIEHAQVRIVDERVAGAPEVVIDDIHIATRGPVALGAPLSAMASASWRDDEQPATAEMRVDRVPDDLAFWPPPEASVHVSLPNTELTSAVAWLGLPALFASGDVDVSVDAVTSASAITGTLDVHGRALSAVATTGAGAGVEVRGEESDASLRSDVRIGVEDLRVEIENFVFTGAGIGIEGNAVFLEPSIAGVESLDAVVCANELARLGLLIPPLRDTAPGALKLAGAGTGVIHASPTEIAIDLDLDGARVKIGEAASKLPGEHLRVSLVGQRDSLAARLADSAPAVAPGRIDGVLHAELPRSVRIDGGLVYQPHGVDMASFDLTTNRTTLERAASLSPVVRDLVAGSVRGGTFAASMRARMSADDDNAFVFALAGRELEIGVDKTKVGGAAFVGITVLTDVRGLRLQVAANLAALSIVTVDSNGEVIFEKRATDALTVRAWLVEVGGPGALGRALDQLDPASQAGGAIFAGSGLSPRWRRFALGLNGRGSVHAAHATLLGKSLDDAHAQLSLARGTLRLAPASVTALGGTVSLSGTVVDLRTEPPAWSVALDAGGLDVAEVLASMRTLTGEVEGTAGARARLQAGGLSLETLLGSLEGPVIFTTHDVRIEAVDAASSFMERIWDVLDAIPFVSRAQVEKMRGASLSDTIRDGEWSMGFHGTEVRLTRPMITLTRLGALTLSGHAAFGGDIDFRARLDLLDGQGAVPVEAALTGTWSTPVFATTNLDRLVEAATRMVGAALLPQAEVTSPQAEATAPCASEVACAP